MLVVSGDYELIHQSRQALADLGYTFSGAFSHRDAQYAVKHGEYDAILVHGLMRDRQTGELTAQSLSSQSHRMPIIVYLPDRAEGKNSFRSNGFQHTISSLEDSTLRHIVLQTLHQSTAPLKNTQVLRGRDDAEFWDVDEVQTLLALTRSLTEVLDLTEVLNRVVESARELTGADEAMILLPDGDSPDLYLRARVGMDIREPRNFRVKTSDSVAGQVYRTGQPMIIGARGPQKVKTEYFVNALLYVPILFKGQPVGVLGVNNRIKQDVFNSHNEALLLNLAACAAIAIENARIHGQSVRRTRELKALVDASQAINASLSLDYTLPTICEQIVRALGVNQAEILEWKRDSQTLRPLARHYQTVWRPGQEPSLTFAEYKSLAAIMRDQRPQLLLSNASVGQAERTYLQQTGAQSMLVLPIVTDGQTFGALIAFYTHIPNQFPSVEEAKSVQYLALETLIEHVDKGRRLNSRVLDLVDQISDLCQADWYEFSLITANHDGLTQHLALGKASWLENDTATFALAPYYDLIETLETQNIINQQMDGDVLTAGVHALLEMTRGRALLGLPLVYRGQAQGIVLCVDTEAGRTFTAREVELARAVVGQAAAALENARLLHDLEASLSQLQQAQARLIQAERLTAMGELAGAVAHQINNPLTTITANSELMLMQTEEGTDDHAMLDAILRSGKRAAAVVHRLLAAVHKKPDNAPPTQVNVITTIEDTLSLVKSHIERDGIRINVQFPPMELPPVLAVLGELEDVWLNLLLNAQDALAKRPKAVINVAAEYLAREDAIRVDVSDNGSGIPESVMEKIFEPFFTTKPIGEGTGLGLHICHQVIERIGGQITVESAPNQGTRFSVMLPVQKRS